MDDITSELRGRVQPTEFVQIVEETLTDVTMAEVLDLALEFVLAI